MPEDRYGRTAGYECLRDVACVREGEHRCCERGPGARGEKALLAERGKEAVRWLKRFVAGVVRVKIAGVCGEVEEESADDLGVRARVERERLRERLIELLPGRAAVPGREDQLCRAGELCDLRFYFGERRGDEEIDKGHGSGSAVGVADELEGVASKAENEGETRGHFVRDRVLRRDGSLEEQVDKVCARARPRDHDVGVLNKR